MRVSASVPLSEFDSPEFHDRMQRAKSNQMAPMQLAMAVPSLIGASIGVIGVAIGLATVTPWLVGVTLIACVPLWFVGRSNSESMYSFSFGNTPNDRMRDIRSIVSRFVRRSAIGSAVGTLVIAGLFAAVYVLVTRGSLSIGAAATASVAVLLLANRGQQVATNLGQMLGQGSMSRICSSCDISGGQWQRIAIARVLFRDASFIVLDEPTAALDAEAEAELFETIEGLREGRTVVIISHRFSTVRSADRILVLHDGRLVEQGSHDALMRANGRYAHMYTLQAETYVAGSRS